MTAVESKEDISDNDSGIILHSGNNIIKEMCYKWSIPQNSIWSACTLHTD